MKKVCLIVILLSSVVFSQEIKTDSNGNAYCNEPFDDCTTIVITTKEKEDDAFKTMGRLMFNSGYEIDSRDEILGILTSKFVKKSYGFLGMGTLTMQILAQIDKDDSLTYIKITGRYDNTEKYISNRGLGGSPAKSSWEFLNDLVSKYPKTEKLIYKKENFD